MYQGIIIDASKITSAEQALNLVSKIGDQVYAFKITKLYDMYGPELITKLKQAGAQRIWNASDKLSRSSATTSHADIISVTEADQATTPLQVFASLGYQEVFAEAGSSPWQKALAFAKLAEKAGIRKIVCSQDNFPFLYGDGDIHLMSMIVSDEYSIMSDPRDIVRSGVHYLMFGNQIATASDPERVLNDIKYSFASIVEEQHRGERV